MADPPPPTTMPSSPHRADNDAIVSANNAPRLPPSPPSIRYDRAAVAASLSYGGNKCVASPNRAADGVSSPPESWANRLPTPGRIGNPLQGGNASTITSSYQELFDEEMNNPRRVTPSPVNVSATLLAEARRRAASSKPQG
mmetsp:Transcript_13580/g.24914  ORF Transcript_13580/g.24914 Transcript_13580/m.24914 type:complete len:141 (+) Transcript_13580:17-439(+)